MWRQMKKTNNEEKDEINVIMEAVEKEEMIRVKKKWKVRIMLKENGKGDQTPSPAKKKIQQQ